MKPRPWGFSSAQFPAGVHTALDAFHVLRPRIGVDRMQPVNHLPSERSAPRRVCSPHRFVVRRCCSRPSEDGSHGACSPQGQAEPRGALRRGRCVGATRPGSASRQRSEPVRYAFAEASASPPRHAASGRSLQRCAAASALERSRLGPKTGSRPRRLEHHPSSEPNLRCRRRHAHPPAFCTTEAVHPPSGQALVTPGCEPKLDTTWVARPASCRRIDSVRGVAWPENRSSLTCVRPRTPTSNALETGAVRLRVHPQAVSRSRLPGELPHEQARASPLPAPTPKAAFSVRLPTKQPEGCSARQSRCITTQHQQAGSTSPKGGRCALRVRLSHVGRS
jgi:hypothetical protein